MAKDSTKKGKKNRGVTTPFLLSSWKPYTEGREGYKQETGSDPSPQTSLIVDLSLAGYKFFLLLNFMLAVVASWSEMQTPKDWDIVFLK